MAAENDAAAYSRSIGNCWIGLLMNIANDPKVKKELSIPDNHEACSELIFGIPKGKTSSSLRRPPKSLNGLTNQHVYRKEAKTKK